MGVSTGFLHWNLLLAHIGNLYAMSELPTVKLFKLYNSLCKICIERMGESML